MKSKLVDRDGRNSARLLISKWLEGKITNYEVEDGWPWDSYDDGVVDIGKETWSYYNDFPEQVLSAESLSQQELDILRRCLRFLDSSEPYLPPGAGLPDRPRSGQVSRVLRRHPNLTVCVEERRRKWWPFSDEGQLQRATLGEEGSDKK